ncbi:MAG TPA: hypothetical protein VFV92_04710 [Candidatus Bathyarchaeia archaeon]|nr:hypothetical protein [Candidatus Bathyarchaeia archaeon]HEX4920023.1 hypothetical protein [Candidatus Bathyarchaeia archaeon]
MRTSAFQHRPSFLLGMLAGMVLVAVKLIVVLPVDIADFLYGATLLVTLAIAFGDLIDFKIFTRHSRQLDFIVGLLFPLDCYAVLILFSIPLPN